MSEFYFGMIWGALGAILYIELVRYLVNEWNQGDKDNERQKKNICSTSDTRHRRSS